VSAKWLGPPRSRTRSENCSEPRPVPRCRLASRRVAVTGDDLSVGGGSRLHSGLGWPLAAAGLVFAAGFGALLLFWLLGEWPTDRGLFFYRAATVGDGILLPLIVGVLVAAFRSPSLVRATREAAWNWGSFAAGLTAGAVTQAAWLLDDSPAAARPGTHRRSSPPQRYVRRRATGSPQGCLEPSLAKAPPAMPGAGTPPAGRPRPGRIVGATHPPGRARGPSDGPGQPRRRSAPAPGTPKGSEAPAKGAPLAAYLRLGVRAIRAGWAGPAVASLGPTRRPCQNRSRRQWEAGPRSRRPRVPRRRTASGDRPVKARARDLP